MSVKNPKTGNPADRVIVPCGRCPVCLSHRREEWTIRLTEEAKEAKKAYFITLTYSDENLPKDYSVDKTHLQKFFKKLRKKFSFRYYAIGEYGTKTYRPHYHIIIFINKVVDIDRHVQATWNYGMYHIGEVNVKSIKYVAKYHVNKTHYISTQSKPFALMSRKPAIGYAYIEKMRDYHEGNINRSFYQEYEFKKRLPRYYKQKLYTDEELQQIATLTKIEDKELKEYEEFKQKYPKGSYFEYKHQQVVKHEKNYKQKINHKNTI